MSLISLLCVAGCSCLLMFPSVHTFTLPTSTRIQNLDRNVVPQKSFDINYLTFNKNPAEDNREIRDSDVRTKNIKSRGQIFVGDFSDESRWQAKGGIPESKRHSEPLANFPRTGVNLLDNISDESLSSLFNLKKSVLNVNSLNVTNNSNVTRNKQNLQFSAAQEIPVKTGITSSSTSLDSVNMKLFRRKRSAHHSTHSSGSTHSNGGTHGSVMVDACEKVSEWVYLSEAEDVNGNTVQVLDFVEAGVRQVFYETYCRRNATSAAGGAGHVTGAGRDSGNTGSAASCTGVDATLYNSVCLDGHSYVYGKVSAVDSSGVAVGGGSWKLIKIRTSCNCGLIRKHRGGGSGARSGRRSK